MPPAPQDPTGTVLDPTGTVLGPHGDSAGTPRLQGAPGAGRRGWCCEAAVAGGDSGALTAAWGGRAAQDGPWASTGAQPWSSLGVDQGPGALPEAKALGTEVLGVTTCRGWKGDTGEAGTGAGPPQGAHPAWTGQGLPDLLGEQGGPGSAGDFPALWLARSVPKSSCWATPFTPTPQSPGQASREGGAHLCSRSPHLCLPGWWTPGSCHTWHSGSRTCARTAGQEQSPVRPQGQDSQALVPASLPALFLIQRGCQRALNGIKAFPWNALPAPQDKHREETPGVVTAPVLIWFWRPFAHTLRSNLCSNFYNNL